MSEIEPVTERDIDEVLNARAAGYDIRYALEQDRRRVAQRQAARHQLGPIERDDSYMRTYIPVAPGWEIQTKGKGSTFRICDSTTKNDGDRLAVPDSPYLHDTIERMALAIHAHRLAQEVEIERLRAEVAQADADYNDAVTLAQMNLDLLKAAEAEVAALKAACAQKDGALGICRDMLSVVHDVGQFTRSTKVAIGVAESALSTDAGKGWIDATGAVEAVATLGYIPGSDGPTVGVYAEVPAEWAGSRVLNVRKP